MSPDRDHEQCLDLGPDDRAARREGVGGGAGRCRADHAVAAEAGHRTAVDREDDLQHPFRGHLLHGRLVERPVAVQDVAVLVHDDVERHPFLDLVGLRHDPVDDLVEVVALGLGEETDATEVDAEHRDTGGAGELGAAQQGAVAAEDDEEFTAVERVGAGFRHLLDGRRQRQVLGLRLQDADADAAAQQAEDDQFGAAHGGGPAGVREEEDGTWCGLWCCCR